LPSASTIPATPPTVAVPSADLLQDLSDADAALLHSKLTELAVRCGETIIHQGAAGDCLYLVRRGELEVRRGDKLLARLSSGHVVGEMALLNREPRNADVIAVTDGVLARLAATDFEELCRRAPQLRWLLTRLVARRLNWSDADLLARRIGPYQVVAQLGAGAMGWVFRAVCAPAEPGQPADQVALKMLPHPLVERPGFLDRFRQEASLLQRLQHPHIVRLRDTIELYGTIFLALEFVPGANAREWVDQRGLPTEDDARCIVRSVMAALQAAHASGVLHRDVKPDNLMIRHDGVVKLTGFGIAAPITAPGGRFETGIDARVRRPGSVWPTGGRATGRLLQSRRDAVPVVDGAAPV